jgi:hypothetical protein
VQDDQYAFIVRIWCEAVDERGRITAWRGSIDEVGSDRRLYFQSLPRMNRFIRQQLGLSADQSGLVIDDDIQPVGG